MARTPLGDYLRGSRGRIVPDQVGVLSSGQRRVSGLRREEVAALAGVSVDYYVRLEQGRERSPSTQVLDALGRALLLDEDGRLHLFRLAGLAPRPAAAATPARVDPQLLQLMSAWPDQPAVVLDRAHDVLALNGLAGELFRSVSSSPNLVRVVFLEPAARSFYADWAEAARSTVAGLRLADGAAPDDPRVREVVAELLDRSPEFRRLWQDQTARGKTLERKVLVHPEVGPVVLHVQAFDVRAAPGQQLVVYSAEPGSPSAQALRLLGTLAATRAQEAPSAP